MQRSLEQDTQANDFDPVAQAAAPAPAHDPTVELANLQALRPGDAEGLAQRLGQFPELREQILAWATAHLGNDTVYRALAALPAPAVADTAVSDDQFVREQMEVMEAEAEDKEFVAFQMGVMAAQQAEPKPSPADADAAFMEEQLAIIEAQRAEELAARKAAEDADAAFMAEQLALITGEKEQAAFEMGQAAEAGKDAELVESQLALMAAEKDDKAFVDEQIALMGEQQKDKAFVDEQIEVMTAEQDDAQFVNSTIAIMEAEQKEQEGEQTEPAPTRDQAPPVEAKDMVDNVAQVNENAPQVIGAALAENPELRAPIVEEATRAQGAAVVAEAVQVERETNEAQVEETPQEEPAAEAKAEAPIEDKAAQPAVEEAWVAGARRYNERHPELVEMFHQHTEDLFRLPDGSVAPEVIVAWQKANGVAVDGRIGPETVAAAKAGAKKVPLAEAAQAPVAEEEAAEADDEA